MGEPMVKQPHTQDRERFDILLAEFIATGKKAQQLTRRGIIPETGLQSIRSEARHILDHLIPCLRMLDKNDDRRLLFASAVIIASASYDDLTGLELMVMLDEILAT